MPTTDTRPITLELDEHAVVIAAEALRAEADRHRRTGVTLSAELMEKKRAGTDVRSGGLQVMQVLADGDALADVADRLVDAWETAKPKTRRRRPPATPPTPPADDDPDPDPDATLAGLGPDDDPDVAAARAALDLDTIPEPVAPAGATTPPV